MAEYIKETTAHISLSGQEVDIFESILLKLYESKSTVGFAGKTTVDKLTSEEEQLILDLTGKESYEENTD